VILGENLLMLATYARDQGSENHNDVWFDLLNPTNQEMARVEASTGLKLPSREKLSGVENSSRVSEVNGVFFLSMPSVTSAHAVDDLPSPVGFVLSENALVTIRFAQLRSFDATAGHFNEEKKVGTGSEVFAALMDQMVDARADLLEKIGGELDALSRSIFPPIKGRSRKMKSNAALRAILVDVGNAGERLSHIRESILGLQRIIPFVFSKERSWIEAEIVNSLKSAQSDLASLADYEAQLYGKVQFLLDAILGFITTKQNDIFQVLTVVSVAGIPPTLIASIYGMNFKNMPELNWTWGYPYALALIAFSTIVPLLWFKWRGWF
jgi:magnesium transporter